MKAARLQHRHAASRNRDAIFTLTHLHHIAIHDHFMELDTTGKLRRCRDQPVVTVPVVGDGQIAAGGGHAGRGRAYAGVRDFNATGNRRAGEHQDHADKEQDGSCHRGIAVLVVRKGYV